MIKTYSITDFYSDRLLSYQTSDKREMLHLMSDRAYVAVGGFMDSVGTHYARLKDARQSIQQGERFVITAEIDLPYDFYRRQTASLKLITCGSENPYQRMGLWIGQDQFPRLQAERKGLSLKRLWQGGKRLPTGRHEYKLEVIPSVNDSVALLRLFVDGEKWGESTSGNFIDGIDARYYVVNRVVWGIDGAASQDKYQLSLDLYRVAIETDVTPLDPCAELTKRLLAAEEVLGLAELATQSARRALLNAESNEELARSARDAVLAEIQSEGC